MRARLVEEIRAVAAAAAAGERARIRLKLNNLVDPTLIDELYAAGAAGARSRSAPARSACCGPGVEGLSETIQVRSILGRFLEHSRIYSFEAGAATSVFIGSADLMPRNLDRRVEVLVPIEHARARQELQARARQRLRRRRPRLGARERRLLVAVERRKADEAVDHQAAMMRRAQLRARRQTDGAHARRRLQARPIRCTPQSLGCASR